MPCFCFLPSLLSNELHQEDFDTWCPIEVVGKNAEEEEEEEDKEEEEEVEEVEEKKVELLHSPVTLLPDLMEFERCEERSSCGEGERGSSWGPLQTRPQVREL